MRVRREGLSRQRHILDRERNVGLQCGVLAILLFGFVAVEFIDAQPDAGCNRGRLLRLHRPIGQFGDHGHVIIAGNQLAGRCTAELQKIIVLDRRELADTDHDQA